MDIWYLFDLSMDFKANINFAARLHRAITTSDESEPSMAGLGWAWLMTFFHSSRNRKLVGTSRIFDLDLDFFS